jgi:hypothetical protein
VLRAQLEVRAEKEASEGHKKQSPRSTSSYKPGEDFYEWRRYVGDYRPVVVIQAMPEIALTGGSVFAIVMLGPNVPKHFKFKTDFVRMELLRDGTVVEPILPGRVPHIVNEQQGYASMKDVAYYGVYEYPPEAFRPGVKLVLRIWEQGHAEPKLKEIPGELKDRVWKDFKPYFAALEDKVSAPASEAH